MQNWSQEGFVVTKIKDTVPWTCQIKNLNGEPVIGTFYEKKDKKNQFRKFRIEKVLKGHKLYVKWTGYDNLFNYWINKKE